MIAVDASFALKLVLDEPFSDDVRAIWADWMAANEEIIAPTLFRPETLSAIQKNIYRQIMSGADGEAARFVLENLALGIQEPIRLYDVAWNLARRFNRPNIYDCCYLALASIAGCELWTADARLARAVQPTLPWIRLVG